MKINSINNISFRGRIIDAHAHYGTWEGKHYPITALDKFIKTPLNVDGAEDTIERILISNFDGIRPDGLSEYDANIRTLEEIKDKPIFKAFAACQPNKTKGDAGVIEKILEKGDFIGLKFHPSSLELRADSAEYDNYLKLAEKKKLPCLFHSAGNIKWVGAKGQMIEGENNWNNSDPRFLYRLAKRHPNVPIILGHTGANGYPAHIEAIKVLKESIDKNDAKLYCDISWMDFTPDGKPNKTSPNIVKLIQDLKDSEKLDRILFGTDAPLGCYGEKITDEKKVKEAYELTVSNLKNIIKDNFGAEADEIIDQIFYKNADELFFQKNWAKNIINNTPPAPEVVKKLSKTKLGAIIGFGVIAVGALAYTLSDTAKKSFSRNINVDKYNKF